ncbi:MAG: type IV secretion system DNA-binding domain-containing protein [Gammaproteobacteria bacterium]|nr:type IV secretion system DNA-binding domain-containing protein [Gammaproteobacteria bacterium]
MDNITYLARTNHPRRQVRFGIREEDRFSHMYVVGKTGVGKTTFLKNMILQDLKHGNGIALFDPHGDLVDEVINAIPPYRRHDLIYFDVPNSNCPLRYNPVKNVSRDKRPLVASGIMETFRKQFGEKAWGNRMEHILRNCLLTLLDQPIADLADILILLNDKDGREAFLENVENESVLDFWRKEYAKLPPFTRQAAIAPIQNKVGALMSNPVCKRILVSNSQDVYLRKAMEEKKILIFNLSKGKIGEDASNLLGGLLVTSLALAAYSRQDIHESHRVPFYIYCDEFQNFTTGFFANALSELRKYKVGLILAHQYLTQIDSDVRSAVLGNIGTTIVFRLSHTDATYFSKEFDGRFSASDITHLPNLDMYMRLMVNGSTCKAFSCAVERSP